MFSLPCMCDTCCAFVHNGGPARLKGPTLAGGRGSRRDSSSWGYLALTPFYARSQARPQVKKKEPTKKKRKYLRTWSARYSRGRSGYVWGPRSCVVGPGRLAELRVMDICVFYISQPLRLASPRGGSTVAPRPPLSYLCDSAYLAAMAAFLKHLRPLGAGRVGSPKRIRLALAPSAAFPRPLANNQPVQHGPIASLAEGPT